MSAAAKKQWKHWTKYFMRRCGGGGEGRRAAYDVLRANNPDVTFQRLCPKSTEASDFEMDSLDLGRMAEAVRRESLTDPSYFGDIFMAALLIASRKMKPSQGERLRALLNDVYADCVEGKRFEGGLAVARASLEAWRRLDRLPDQTRIGFIEEALQNVAEMHRASGDFEAAAEAHDARLAMVDPREDGEAFEAVASAYTAIGSQEFLLGNFDRAKNFHLRSVGVLTKIHGEEHVSVAAAYMNVASCFAGTTRYAETLHYLERTRDIFEKVGNGGEGDDIKSHPRVAVCLQNLAGIKYATAEYGEARDLYERVLRMKREMYGERPEGWSAAEARSVAVTHHCLGLCALKFGESVKAEEHFAADLEITQRRRGQRSEDEPKRNTARGMHGLASVQELSGQVGEALEGHERALKVLREAFKGRGGRHRDLAKSLMSVGDCQRRLRNLEKAQESLREAKNMLKDLRGDGGGEEAMAECLVAYGKYHFDRGERERAERDFARAMEIRREVFGAELDHDGVAECIFHLGRVARVAGDEDEARELFAESEEMYKGPYLLI